MNSLQISRTNRNRERRVYRKTHPNGRIRETLDEIDRDLIKSFCNLNAQPLRSIVDLERNQCLIFCYHEGQELLLGRIQKVVYKKTFEVMAPFKLFTIRDVKANQMPQRVIISPGTRIFLSEDFNYFWVPVPTKEEWVKVERWIVVKNTSVRQVRSLMIINEENGLGMKDGMVRIDLVELMSPFTSNQNTEIINLDIKPSNILNEPISDFVPHE